MKTEKRKYKCNGCGEERPCYLETNQEYSDFRYLDIEEFVCVMDSTNQTSYNWVEIEPQDKGAE